MFYVKTVIGFMTGHPGMLSFLHDSLKYDPENVCLHRANFACGLKAAAYPIIS
jgi:hypothetical protein